MNDFRGLYDIRSGTEEDHNFILATFLRGLYYGDSFFSDIPKDIFMTKYKLVAQALVKDPGTIISVACLKEDPNVILGYSLLNNDSTMLYWVFVKSAWRHKGIGRSLVPINPQSIAHLTALGKSLLTKFETKPYFNPFI